MIKKGRSSGRGARTDPAVTATIAWEREDGKGKMARCSLDSRPPNVLLFTCGPRSGPSGTTACYTAFSFLFAMFSALLTSLDQQLVKIGATVQLAVGDDGADLLRVADVVERVGIE